MKNDNIGLYHYSFVFFISSFIGGVFISNAISNFDISLFIGVFTLIFFTFLSLYSKKFGIFFVVSFLGILSGMIYSNYNLLKIENNKNKIKEYIGKKVDLVFEIKTLYKKQQNYTSYIANIEKINNKDFKKLDINILVKIPGNYNISNKSIIKTKTKIDKIKNFSNTFNYIRFLESKGVYASCYIFSYEIIGKYDENIFEKYINKIREKFLFSIRSIFPPDEANLLAGILIGERKEISKEIQTDFNNSGLTHIVAVSGFNITIIIVFLTHILKIFPVFFRTIFISFFIILFVFIVGDNIARIRAAIMGLIGYYILVSGRQGKSIIILIISAFLLVLYNPLIINYDISFQLSFLAVLGLIYTKNFFDKIFLFLPKIFAIRESFVLTLSAFSFTIPIIMVYFGQVSILAPLANVAIGWVLPFTMLFGFIRVIVDFFSHRFSYYIGFLAWGFLHYILETAHFFGNFYFSVFKIDLGFYAFYFLSLYYIILVFLILWFSGNKKEDN